MGAKIKVKLDVLNVIDKTRDFFGEEVKNKFGQELTNSISKGVNPVNGGDVKYDQYSESYKKSIRRGKVEGKGKISPVTLHQTGALHKSLTMVDTEKGVRVYFSDPKAIFHNELGAGKSKVIRRLLPTGEGERFNSSLFNRIIKYLKDSLSKATK